MTDATQMNAANAPNVTRTQRLTPISRTAAHEEDDGSFFDGATSVLGAGAAGLGLAGFAAFSGALSSVVGRAIGAYGGTGVDVTGSSDPDSLFQKQLELQRENLTWTFRTNIAKTEHETRMSSVRNMRP